MKATHSVIDRFHARLVPMPNGCIEYDGYRLAGGYGYIGGSRQSILTHRLAWTLANGPIPEGMFVCHKCDNPPCCNVDNLFLGTPHDNNQDMLAKGRDGHLRKTHCPRGHEYSAENTKLTSTGGRACRTCAREHGRIHTANYRARKRAAAMVVSLREDAART